MLFGCRALCFSCPFTAIRPTEQDKNSDIAQAYELFDEQGTGITLEKLRRVALDLGTNITDDELTLMMEAADCDGDGVVSRAEVGGEPRRFWCLKLLTTAHRPASLWPSSKTSRRAAVKNDWNLTTFVVDSFVWSLVCSLSLSFSLPGSARERSSEAMASMNNTITN